MTKQDKPTLKSYFETGDVPNEIQFSDTIDSFQREYAFDVKSFGAVGNGVSDDTAAIQAALDSLTATLGQVGKEGLVYFPPGDYNITDTLTCRSKYRIHLLGNDAQLWCRPPASMTGKCLLDFQGCTYSKITGIHFYTTLTGADRPTALLIYGRNAAGTGGDIALYGCDFSGNCTVANVVWCQADTSRAEGCNFHANGGTAPPILMSSNNGTGLLLKASSTHTCNSFRNCWFIGSATTTQLVQMGGLIQNITFDTCFFSPHTADCIAIVDDATAGTANQVYKLTMINNQIEGNGESRLIGVRNTRGLNNVMLLNNGWDCTDPSYQIDIASLDAGYGITNMFIAPATSTSSPAKPIIHLITGVLSNSFIMCGGSDIFTEAGTTTSDNYILANGGSTPFGASAGTLSYNIVSSGRGVREPVYYTPPDGEVHPQMNGDIVIFANSLATNVTALLPESVKIVKLVFDGNTTLKAGANFPNQVGDLTPAAGTVIEYINLTGWEWTRII